MTYSFCIGPNVIPSESRLIMICPKKGSEVKKRLRFTNNSETPAIFMFDIDQAHSPFKLDSIRGTIDPNSYIHVTITFSPLRQGLYAIYLPCLIHHQGPIVTEIYGYRGPLFSNAEIFQPLIFIEPKPLIGDFEGYMSDAVKIVTDSYPPISLSDNCLDFGKVEFDPKKNLHYLPQNVSVTNHSTIVLILEWDNDPESVFKITPQTATIYGQKTSFFQVHFIPNKTDALFSREILARGFWGPEITEANSSEPVPIPLVTSVRMIGQSFSSESWIPQYEVPQTVSLPPCLPLLPAYATFLIKLCGDFPMTFRFIPPAETNYSLKPMVGIIDREYQIIILRLFPKVDVELAYIERWTIQFNGNCKNNISIEFKAYAEYPKLDINLNNVVEFDPVHPECEQVTQVAIQNPTQHCIRYSFSQLPSAINMRENSNGIIRANEILTQDWTYLAPKEIGDYSHMIISSLQILKAGGYPFCTNINIPVEITGKVQHGYLVASPDELNFGIVAYGQTKKLSFQIFNFSCVKIHYALIFKQRGWPIGNIERDIKVLPAVETIHPGCEEKIDISITPHESGFYQLTAQYLLRSNSLTKDVLRTVEPRDICKLDCMCIFPGFEVKDLLYFSFVKNISKALLWNLLEIDKFNVAIRSVLPGSEKVINLRFPELVLSPDPLLINLLILNSTPAHSTWSLTRVKKCDCPQIVKTRGMSFKYKEYLCDHRLACAISPNKGNLQPHGEIIITIKVCYILPGKTSLQWRLKLSDNRDVIINADIVALSDIEIRPSLLADNTLSLDKIYIGDMEAVNQICWIHNSTDYQAAYSLDIGPLHKINNENLCETFLCRNPHGYVPKRSYYPIIFKFQPRRFQSYQINLPLKLGNASTNLSIETETGILPKATVSSTKVPRSDTFSVSELPVHFSVDHIDISSMPMHSKVTRMIMIFNESKNEVIGYHWKSYNTPKILEIKTMPASGRIQPKKAQSFRITIRSLSQPCKITATLCCKFLNLSAQRTYEKSIIMYNSLCDELAGQFVITEKGMTEPKPWLKPAEKPKPFYKSLTIDCYIYSFEDTDLKATVNEQLKSSMPPEIQIKKNEICSITDKELINIATFVLEGMIWQILDSNLFISTSEESLNKKSRVKYGQYVISPMQRRNLQDRSYDIPPKQFLESIFEQMILGIVHEEFGLSMSHFDNPEDIRQFHCQKRNPLSRRQNKMSKSNLQSIGSMNQLETGDGVIVETKRFCPESQVKFRVEEDDLFFESNDK